MFQKTDKSRAAKKQGIKAGFAKVLAATNRPWFRVALVIAIGLTLSGAWLNAFKIYKAEVLTKSADTLVDIGQLSKASEQAKRAVDLNPLNGYAWFQLGTAKYLQRDPNGAISAFNQAIPVLPHAYNAVRLVAITEYNLKKYEAAASKLSSYLEMNPKPAVTPEEIYRMAGLSWLRVGDLSKSNYYLTWASHFAEDNSEILKVQAMVTVLMNQPETADYFFRAFRAANPEQEFNPYELITNAIAANKLNGALSFLESIHRRNQADLSLTKVLALGYSRGGFFTKAEQLLSGASDNFPENADIRLLYGDVLFAQRKYEEAFRQYDEHLQLAPDSQFRQDILKKKATSRY